MIFKLQTLFPLVAILSSCLAQTLPTIVYRADLLPPDDLRRQRAFLPRGEDGTRPFQPPPNLSLYNHTQGAVTGTSRYDSGYVSTTTSYDFARRFVQTTLGGSGHIYTLHVTPNFIDVNSTLRQFYTHTDEAEFAALGRIHYIQTMGWVEVIGGVEQPYVSNPDYEARWFDDATAGGFQPQLAGFPPNHVAWNMQPWVLYSDCLGTMSSDASEQCHPMENNTDFASDYYGSAAVTGITINVKISKDNWGGTSDKIYAKLGDLDPLIELFDGPSAGDVVHKTVRLFETFGRSSLALKSLSKIRILQKPEPHPIASDDFKLESKYLNRHEGPH